MKEFSTLGTFILKNKGCYLKVISVRPVGDNTYVFDCRQLDSRNSEVLTFRMLGLLETIDTATQHMKESKDILLMDLDNNGLWKIIPKEHVEKLERESSKHDRIKTGESGQRDIH